MNNNRTAFDKLLEEDEEYFELVDNESLCTTCKLEIENQNLSSFAIKQENSIHFEDNINYSPSLDSFDNFQVLQKATRSLSRISLDQNDLKLIDNCDNLEQANGQIVNNNVINNDNNNNSAVVDNTLFTNSPSFICSGVVKALNILDQDQEDSNVKKTRAVISQKNIPLNDAAVINGKNTSLCDKEIQTDLANEPNQADNLWVDNEFLSEKELEKIDQLVNEHKNGDIDINNKRKFDNAGVDGNSTKKIKLGTSDWNKTDYDSMISDILKREKKCLDCSNDLYEYSEYLNETRKAFIRKAPATNIKIPTPPVLVGYDNQFDFKNDKRYVKLPIQRTTINSTNSSKLNGVNGVQNSINTKSRINQQKIVTPNQGPIQKNRPPLPKNQNNPAKINQNNIHHQVNSTPRNTLRQSTIKEAFAINKENHNKALNHVKSINNTISSAKVNPHSNNTKNLEKTLNGDAGKDNISDSSSMYNFNPFRHKNNAQKK